jgi:branched-chain amino acid transport system ATP-binding protein
MTLSLRDVSAGYGTALALRQVSVTVPAGAVVALLGPNGAGKTTLVRVASGLVRPFSGQVTLDDADLTGRPPHEFAGRGICHIPEGRGIFPGLTVRENLVLQGHGTPAHTAVEQGTVAFPVLGRRLDQIAGTLSGGEQQMVAVARAYISNPEHVLLDEVSLGLAPMVVDEIFAFLGRLVERGCALLLVEQYVDRALALADFVYVLDRGRIAFAGESRELEEVDVFATYVGRGSSIDGVDEL